MVSKYPQKTTVSKQGGSGGPTTFKGSQDFNDLLNKPMGTNKDWYDLMNKKRLKKLPLKYVLRRGLGRVPGLALALRALSSQRPQQIDQVNPQQMPGKYWVRLPCGSATGRAPSYWRSDDVCTSFCINSLTSPSPDVVESVPNPTASSGWAGLSRHPTGTFSCNATYVLRGEQRYQRRGGSPVPTPTLQGIPVGKTPVVGGNPVPDKFPTAWSNPSPSKNPFTKANPGEEPSENPWPDELPVYDLPVFDAPVVLLDPPTQSGVIPQVKTQTVSVSGPGDPPVVTVKPGNPVQQPPGAGKKQDKPTVVKTAGKLWVAINFFTESLDFVEVLWDALPEKCKRKKIFENRWGREATFAADHYSKLEDLYKCLGEIDVAKVITGYINNQIEDYFYGKMSDPTKKLSQELGIISGLDRAIAQAQHWAMTSVDEDGNVKEEAILDAFLPKVDFDPETGEVTLTSLLGETKVNLGDEVL